MIQKMVEKKMKLRNHEPINFPLYQSEMEEIMYMLWVLENLGHPMVKRLKYDLQCKINYKIREGEWK